MIYMITVTLSVLVAINFLLLRFSCNKVVKQKPKEKPFIVKNHIPKVTTQPVSTQLAATGS